VSREDGFGEALEDVIVVGLVTYFVNRAGEDDCPVII